MRDALLIAGTIAAATKQTRVYSADVLDLGAAQKLGYVDVVAKFKLGEAVATGDSYVFEVYDSADNSTFAKCAESAAITSGAAGDIFSVAAKGVRRYVKLAVYPDSSGTLDAQDIESWVDFDFD